MGSISDNIKRLREDADMSQDQLGQRLGKTRSAISQYEAGKIIPRMGVIEDIAAVFNVPKSEILGENVTNLSSSDFIELPVMGEITAGTPIDMTEIIDNHPCPKQIADKHPNSGWLRVEGDSYNRSIPNGCYALIDFDMKEPNEHSPFAVCVNGHSATIKKIKRLANGYELIPNSYDPTYLPIIYDYNKEDTEEITIIGQVVYAAFPFDWEF